MTSPSKPVPTAHSPSTSGESARPSPASEPTKGQHSGEGDLPETVSERYQSPLEAIRFVERYSWMLVEQCTRLLAEVEEAFAGKPFLPDLPPTTPRNQARFKAYCSMHRQAARRLRRATWEWLQIRDLEVLARQGQAAADKPTCNATETALLLAQSLRLHSQVFHLEPLTPVMGVDGHQGGRQFTEEDIRLAEELTRASQDPSILDDLRSPAQEEDE